MNTTQNKNNTSDNYDIIDGFNRIAPQYDRVNDLISFGLHRHWRKKLCRALIENTPQQGKILDVSTGSGDVLLGVLKAPQFSHKRLELVGLDPSADMLKMAEQKLGCTGLGLKGRSVKLLEGRGEELTDIPNESIDSISIAWGIRNIPNFNQALTRFYDVLKPGGRVFILESAQPQNLFFRKFHQFYSKMIPIIGGKVAGYKKAYEYYNATVNDFPAGDQFLEHMQKAGFGALEQKALNNGLVYIYQGQKPR